MKKVTLTILTLLFSGCANFNSVHHNLNVADGNGALIDIKQRAILSIPVRGTDGRTTETRVCAEPSPDALSAYAAEFAAKASNSQVSAGLNSAFQEGSAFVGMRTQSIQLLRDFGYRLCEGYMSGAIQPAQYDLLMRRFQKNAVALLAIEQLTGAVKIPPIALTTSGKLEETKAFAELRSEREKIGNQISKLEAEKTMLEKSKKAALEKDLKADTTEFDTKHKEIEDKISRLKDDLKFVDSAIVNNKGVIAEGKTVVEINTNSLDRQRSDEHIQKVAEIVSQIVLEVVNADDGDQLCLSRLQAPVDEKKESEKQFFALCLKRLTNRENAIEENINALRKANKDASAATTSSAKDEAKRQVEIAKDDLAKNIGRAKIKSIKPKVTE